MRLATSPEGLPVRLVATPEPALAGLADGPADAAVLDLTMPGLDPRRIRQALRAPVVFLLASARPQAPRASTGRGDGAAGRRWLTRPFGPRELVAWSASYSRSGRSPRPGKRSPPTAVAGSARGGKPGRGGRGPGCR